jgi:hypothetical protein
VYTTSTSTLPMSIHTFLSSTELPFTDNGIRAERPSRLLFSRPCLPLEAG